MRRADASGRQCAVPKRLLERLLVAARAQVAEAVKILEKTNSNGQCALGYLRSSPDAIAFSYSSRDCAKLPR